VGTRQENLFNPLFNPANNIYYTETDSVLPTAIYFLKGGDVKLDLPSYEGLREIRWRNILDGTIQIEEPVKGGKSVSLKTPGSGHWVLILKSII